MGEQSEKRVGFCRKVGLNTEFSPDLIFLRLTVSPNSGNMYKLIILGEELKEMNEIKRIAKNPIVMAVVFVLLVIVFDIVFLSVKTNNITKKANESVEQWRQYYESLAASAPAASVDGAGSAAAAPQLQVSEEAKYLARVVAGCATYNSQNVQRAVAWCVLNRVDSALYPDSIIEVCEQANQWQGYENASVIDEIAVLCQGVIDSWQQGGSREIPQDCLFFKMTSNGIELRTEYTGGNTWKITNE